MNFGISLSGGGAKGAAHIGVIKALEEAGIVPQYISGASAGSIVGGLYAYGYSANELKEITLDIANLKNYYIDYDIFGIIKCLPNIIINKEVCIKGFIKGDRLENLFSMLTKDILIRDVKKLIIIPSVDLETGNTVVFSNVESSQKIDNVIWKNDITLAEAIRASMSVPAVFKPKILKDFCLVDGGITNNLPVDLLYVCKVPKILAVDITKTYEPPVKINLMEVIGKSFDVMSRNLKELTSTKEVFLLKPDLCRGKGLLDFENANTYINEAYEYTKKRIDELERVFK